MSVGTHTTLVGVFTNQSDAQAAIRDLKRMGVRDDQIGVVSPHTTKVGDTPAEGGDNMMAEGAAVGAATGAGVGALWALGIAAGALPAIGPVVAGGLLASVLASAAGGAATAGLIGALIGLGVSEDDATFYEGEVKSGRTLVTVRDAERSSEVAGVLRNHGGYDIHNQGMSSRGASPMM